jgi:hypothetical protein
MIASLPHFYRFSFSEPIGFFTRVAPLFLFLCPCVPFFRFVPGIFPHLELDVTARAGIRAEFRIVRNLSRDPRHSAITLFSVRVARADRAAKRDAMHRSFSREHSLKSRVFSPNGTRSAPIFKGYATIDVAPRPRELSEPDAMDCVGYREFHLIGFHRCE